LKIWGFPTLDFTVGRFQPYSPRVTNFSEIEQSTLELTFYNLKFGAVGHLWFEVDCHNSVASMGLKCLQLPTFSKIWQSATELFMTEQMLSGLVLQGAWTQLYQIWWGHRHIIATPKVYCWSLSKPGAWKTTSALFTPLKIMGGMGEICESAYRRSCWCFRLTIR